jgi:hypothetical protein
MRQTIRFSAVSATAVCLGMVLLAGEGRAADACSACGMSHTHAVDVSDRTDFPFLTGHFDGRLHLDQVYNADDPESEIYWGKVHFHGDLRV